MKWEDMPPGTYGTWIASKVKAIKDDEARRAFRQKNRRNITVITNRKSKERSND